MFKNTSSICYIFFAIDDLIVTSVNTYIKHNKRKDSSIIFAYTLMMGISTEDKYVIKSLPENKKYGCKVIS